jgi:NADPH2:quinone reductase
LGEYFSVWKRGRRFANDHPSRLSSKNIKLLRPTLFNYIYTREELQKYASELWDFITKDGLKVKIHEVYPLEDVARAHTDIESRKTTGKLLLKP